MGKEDIRIINKSGKKGELGIASFFSGAGGLDLGFTNAGFDLVFANDNWKGCWETFEKNHNLPINKESIVNLKSENVPEVIGFIGGPPCQSWSLAGSMRGVGDSRGKLFYEYLRIIEDKKPLFFLAENVPGIISKTHLPEFEKLLDEFRKLDYRVSWRLLSANEFGVPQKRRRVIIIGYRKDLGKKFNFDNLQKQEEISLKETIGDLTKSLPAKDKNKPNPNLKIINNEYMIGGFSTMYMSRNRKKNWDQPSFTIQAGGRHAPLHPNSPKMNKLEADKWEFDKRNKNKLRRLSVRECARIQTFPDNFKFYYDNVAKGYKMIGNAVPVKLAEVIAKQIMKDLTKT